MRKPALIVLLLLLGIVLATCVRAWILRCPTEVNTYLGEFDSTDAGLRASIPKLAAEVRRCPEAEVYRIIWIGPGDKGERLQHSTLYYRRNKAIAYEADAFSGGTGKGYVVDDSAIQAVADRGGTLDDFAEYDQSHR